MSNLFVRPRSLEEAQAALSEWGDEAKVIAGGSAVVLMIQQKLIAPRVLVSLESVPDLSFVDEGSGGLHLGPMLRLRELERSALLRQKYPALATACHLVGNVRVRNQATIGGNLAEADYASDPPAMLLALDAAVNARGPSGERSIPLADFFYGFYTTALEEGELITGLFIPALPDGARSVYLKYKSRSAEDRPCVGVAAVATFDGDLCHDLRVAVGAACEVPRRLAQFEGLAKGESLSGELIAEIANGYAANIETIDDLRGSAWYRQEMIRVYVTRALEEVRSGHR